MVGSARKAVMPGICRNPCFQQYGADSVYDLVLSTGYNQTVEKAELRNVMYNDAKLTTYNLTWGRSY